MCDGSETETYGTDHCSWSVQHLLNLLITRCHYNLVGLRTDSGSGESWSLSVSQEMPRIEWGSSGNGGAAGM